jgi:hypothetical protein
MPKERQTVRTSSIVQSPTGLRRIASSRFDALAISIPDRFAIRDIAAG